MKRFLTVSILVFLAVFVSNAYAPDEQKFKVYVDVTTEKEDETEKQIIRHYINLIVGFLSVCFLLSYKHILPKTETE